MSTKKAKFIWIPRVIAIIFILFMSIFALDVFSEDVVLIKKLLGFLIHLIPSFILITLLIISWNRPLAGGYIFGFISILFTVHYSTYKHLFMFLTFTVPLIIISILFFVSYVSIRKGLSS
jgi:hypothetical protein